MATEKDADEQARLLKILGAAYGKHTDDLQDYWTREAKGREYYLKKSKKQYDDIETSIKNLKTKINTVGVTSDELESELSNLRAEIARTTDADKKAALMKAKSELEMRNAGNKAIETIQSTAGKVIGIGLAGAITNMTAAVKRAAAGGSAMEVAAGLMEARVDTTNQQFQAVSGGMQEFGGALAGAGGKAKYLGLALTVAGAAVGFVSNQMTELAKAGIGFLLSQTTKMIQGFQDMSKVGAVFAGGMQEMTQVALSAGMTIDQFSKAVEASRVSLSTLGMGINEASKRMAGVMSGPGGKKMQEGMFALGMSAEEQATTVADAMSIMAGPTGRLKASNKEIQETTAQYARDLKIISNITGEDAKTRMEKLRQENDTLAFNSYLNGLSEKERTKQVAAMALMSAEDARAFREKKIYGTVISADLNAARATNAGVRKAQDEAAEAAIRGQLDTTEQAKIYNRNQKEIQEESMKRGRDMGLAQQGIGAEASKAMNSITNHANKFGDIQKGINEINTSQGKGAKQSGADLMKMNQEFAVQMQEIAEKALPYFSAILKSTAAEISGAVNEALSNISGPSAKGIWEKLLGYVKEFAGTIVATLAGGAALEYFKTKLMGGGVSAAESIAESAGGGGGAKKIMGKNGRSYWTMAKEATPAAEGAMAGAGKWGSRLLQGAKGGIGGLVGGVALDYAGDALTERGYNNAGAAAGVGSSALSGAGLGATIGSVIPGVGTVIGGAVGGALGGAYGLYQNWGKFGSGTQTPATAAAASMNAEPDAATVTAMADAKADSQKMYDKIVELASSSKSVADALSKDTLTELAKANQKLADAQKDLTSYTKDIKETMAKLLQVSR